MVQRIFTTKCSELKMLGMPGIEIFKKKATPFSLIL
jgi:hypothetical protein